MLYYDNTLEYLPSFELAIPGLPEVSERLDIMYLSCTEIGVDVRE